MREAVAQMKMELGDDAVILHTKKYKDGGFLGVGSREMIELTAAIEDEKPAKKELTTEKISPPSTAQSTSRPSSVVSQYRTSGTAEGVALAEAQTPSMPPPPPVTPPPAPEPENDDDFAQRLQEAEQAMEPETPTEEETEDRSEGVREAPEDEPEGGEEWAEESAPRKSEGAVPVPIDDAEAIERAAAILTAAMTMSTTAEPVPQAEPEPQSAPLPTEISTLSAAAPNAVDQSSARSEQMTSTPPEAVQSDPQSYAPPEPAPAPEPVPGTVTLTTEQLAQMQAAMMAQAMAQVQMNAVAQPPPQYQQPQYQAPPPQPVQAPPPPVEPQPSEAVSSTTNAPASQPPPAQNVTVGETRSDGDNSGEEKIKKLEAEIAQMKAMLAQVLGRDVSRGKVTLHEALRQQEVSEEILNDMAVSAGAGETLVDCISNAAHVTLSNYLQSNILFTEGIKLNRHGVRIAALLGTTGVGKTTTLAKIAAKFVLESQATAALITADTYRISAVEQLRTYSDILGLPLEIVYTPSELSKAIVKHRSKDLILIDTAGRSQHNDDQMRELRALLSINQRIEKHLVLSVTTKQSDAKAIIEKFSLCEPDRIIFTKADETETIGLIVNLLAKQKIGLSYLTNGQSVPDDILSATPENLADLLLRTQ